jgi:transposase-like protein
MASSTTFGARSIMKGEVLESFGTKRLDRKAASKFLKNPMKRHCNQHIFLTYKLQSSSPAMKVFAHT